MIPLLQNPRLKIRKDHMRESFSSIAYRDDRADKRAKYKRKAAEAAPHTLANSEYLIVVARKGCKS